MPDDRPHALIAEQQRVRGSRAATARALTRRRFRRRVLPPLAVTSAVLLGTGAASAWVYGAIEHKASTPTGSNADDQLSTLEQLRAQLAADQQALASIAGAAPAGSDSAATLPSTDGSTSAAGQPLATTPSGTTPKGQPAPTRAAVGTSKTAGTVNAGGPAGTAVTTHAPAAGQTQPAAGQPQPPAAQPTANPGTPTQAPKPAPAPVPSATAPAPAPKPTPPPPAPTPTVHATSGASGG
ncbi:MAG: hypothetical protein QOH29_191 [Actinomycetota bacterium]|nr:hypothetical protein [Actinomycetota bacterium]